MSDGIQMSQQGVPEMSILNIKSASLFEIGKNSGFRPVYNYRYDWPVASGTPAEDVIAHAKQLQLVADQTGTPPAGSYIPARRRGRPERYLDVDERRNGGDCLYVFCLNVKHGVDERLRFMRNRTPYVTLPLNSTGGENFIKKIEGYVETDLRFAAFACNPDDVRNSGLAHRIQATMNPHVYRLNIPFYFNVEDPELRAAPWVLTDHSQSAHFDSDLDLQASHGHIPRHRTHGGVHPGPMAMLSVRL
jgi:hypothetical protein